MKLLSISAIFIAGFSASINAQTQVDTFYYTGSSETFIVPSCVTDITFDVRGGKGGDLAPTLGGAGGRVIGSMSITPGDVLYINVGLGGPGNQLTAPGVYVGSGGTDPYLPQSEGFAGVGGGASDIRLNGTTLNDRIIVGGGGGGAGGTSTQQLYGGAGGGLIGGTGLNWNTWPTAGGKGGTQSAGGAAGTAGGGQCATYITSGALGLGGLGTGDAAGGGGGGGGYYGGGGACFSGGGGGSSYTDPSMTTVSHTQGFQNGDGMIILTYVPGFTSTSSLSIVECDSLVSPSGNYTWTATGVYNDTIPNALGCDSIITVDLSINYSITGTDVQTACVTYDWIDGNTYTASNNTAQWTLTNAAGCDSVVTLDLTINPMPDNNATQSGSLLTADLAGAMYQWLDCDDNNSIINGETNQSFTPTAITGNYAVEVTLNGCADTSACFLVDYTGLSEMYAEIITIHPNPTSDILIVSGLNEISGLKDMEITSSNGDVVIKINGMNEEINVSFLTAGIYFLNINHEQGVETIRFVKQ